MKILNLLLSTESTSLVKQSALNTLSFLSYVPLERLLLLISLRYSLLLECLCQEYSYLKRLVFLFSDLNRLHSINPSSEPLIY